MNIRLLYISQSGNTRAFVTKLVDYAKKLNGPQFEAVEINDLTPDHHETEPYFVFVPTYLDGGNGIDTGVKEIMTNALYDYLDYGNNARHLLGVIGSGNKNFNIQYVLTAKRYAETFGAPLIADYELRGTEHDIDRIYQALCQRIKAVSN
ncbi:protein involved in ribonucleotide reduction [Weissella uvarum]|uniref:class Ib ribonucleoside-diphosphate reductase assembly flavoprotein NrdI n=1 Tax=Weissella uvarum TaxID=1479233 RepID=UPI00195F943E|nr:class Ib ribonucleoside-diphosphate reductase assembly flavoprotein NrdI [Weissella uvarum]MBM7617825.1 protein involved in ribonucleotide reduction [Weissella uvarum]MCM0595796.1 class Ib ribonucleoside-diphosphate reductase assembly flavoprotein NrdI [Weissella uvarum]